MTIVPPLVVVEADAGVLTLTLNRPQSSNALDPSLVAALDIALDAASSVDVGCVLLRAAGKRFCVGGDVTAFGAGSDVAVVESHVVRTAGVVRRLRELEAPLVVAAQGAVAGAGLALVLAADVTVAGRSTRFVPAYNAIGLTPDVGVSWLLTRAVGERRALQYLVSGTELTAAEACDWGIVSEVVDDDSVGGHAESICRRIAASGFAARETKRLLRSASTATTDDSAGDEAATFGRALSSDLAQRRIADFLDRH
ncbi:enoyl-CoA hydratase/isomerase family protein [Longivirga aurantiaca]|uniref:Enoyl-CoA hydratase/isomerase family protein n=1 Tax=Longivirga aurantiaca TaxID=1837743 RepID=A0ABW1SYB3_9ACTN